MAASTDDGDTVDVSHRVVGYNRYNPGLRYVVNLLGWLRAACCERVHMPQRCVLRDNVATRNLQHVCRVPGVAAEALADIASMQLVLDVLSRLEGMDSRRKHPVRDARSLCRLVTADSSVTVASLLPYLVNLSRARCTSSTNLRLGSLRSSCISASCCRCVLFKITPFEHRRCPLGLTACLQSFRMQQLRLYYTRVQQLSTPSTRRISRAA